MGILFKMDIETIEKIPAFVFNKIYVIESLNNGERQTGKDL